MGRQSEVTISKVQTFKNILIFNNPKFKVSNIFENFEISKFKDSNIFGIFEISKIQSFKYF